MTQNELIEIVTNAINAIDAYRRIDPYFNDDNCEAPWKDKPINYRLCVKTLGYNVCSYHDILHDILDDPLTEGDVTQIAGYLWGRLVSDVNLMRRNNAGLRACSLTARDAGLEIETKELENAIVEIKKRILIVDSYEIRNER